MKPLYAFKKKSHNLLVSGSQSLTSTGFTLTELLVTIIIGSIITSTLLWLIVNLLNSGQRESALSETQRDMQRTLDYIASDMKEAVYVYDGGQNPQSTDTIPSYYRKTNTALADDDTDNSSSAFLPTFTGIPVLAFWKTDPVDTSVLPADCTMGTPALTNECAALKKRRHTYNLVVYLQDDTNNSGTWSGNARIKRYELTKYANVATLERNKGYVDPAEAGSGVFDTWPYAGTTNLQNCSSSCPLGAISDSSKRGTAEGSAIVVTDFADELTPTGLSVPSCPAGYNITPRATDAGTAPLSYTFYACIRDTDGEIGRNQDVFVYLRGNVEGRAGFQGTSGPTPILQTQITMRGVIEK